MDRGEGSGLTWIAGGRALWTIDNGEGFFENGGKTECVVDAVVLDLAVDGGEPSCDGTGGDFTVTVR